MTKLRTAVINGVATLVPAGQPHRPRPRGNSFEPTRQRIADRDRWTCQLCGKPINPLLKRPHPKALAIHHLHRFADGGTDHDANLAAAHADCNNIAR